MDLVLSRKLCQKFNPYLAQTISSFEGLPMLNLRMELTRIPMAVAMMEAYDMAGGSGRIRVYPRYKKSPKS